MDAPRGSLEFAQSDELDRLRRRAYGPDADITEDAPAQARLSELEAVQRHQRTLVIAVAGVDEPGRERLPLPQAVEGSPSASPSAPDAVDSAFAERQPVSGSVAGQEPVGEPVVDPASIPGVPAAWWRRRRVALLGAVVAALAVNVIIVAWMSQPIDGGSHPIPAATSDTQLPSLPAGQRFGYYVPSPDHVLAVRSDGVESDAPYDRHGTLELLGISPDELRRYDDFEGLNVWSGRSRYGLTCLLVAVPVQGLREGLSAEGCSLRNLHTSTDIAPMSGDGLIRFVLSGNHVDVYVYEHGRDPNASQG